VTNEQHGGPDYQHKIDWLANSSLFAAEHGFLISDDSLGNVLVVELKKEDGDTLRHEFSIPRLADVTEIKALGKGPTISDLQLLEVQHGIRLSAKIGWNTDTLTDATVHYGEKELSESSEPQKRFGRQHQVELHNLKADTTYRFVAVSSDLFGRSQVSEPVTFSTRDSLAASPRNDPMYNILPAEKQAVMECRFSRSGSKYFIELDLVQPSSIYVGSKALPRGQRMPADEFHAGLRNLEGSSLRACLNCHTRHDHPLNVSPQKPGISIPTEFPTLPGGRITCTSCHMPHGSDFYFLTRRPPEKELCSNCHKDRGQ
jgi:predicted CXXCH cytochrome family protein